MKKILLAGALAVALSFAPVAVMAQVAMPAPSTADAPLLSAGPLPPPLPSVVSPEAPPPGLVPPPPPGGFTAEAIPAPPVPPFPAAAGQPLVAGKISAEAPLVPAGGNPSVPPAVAPVASPFSPLQPPTMMLDNPPPLTAALAAPLMPPVQTGAAYPTMMPAPMTPAAAGNSQTTLDKRSAVALREAIRGLAALRELPEKPVNDALLRKVLDIGNQACRLGNLPHFPILPRFTARADDTMVRNRSHGTYEYRKFGAFQTRLDGWIRPVSRFVHCNLHFVGRGRSSVLVTGVISRGADLDADLEIQAGDAFGRLWKIALTARGLLLRDDGLPAGGTLAISGSASNAPLQQISWQFPIEDPSAPQARPSLRKQDGMPVAIPPEPWQLRDAPKAVARASARIAQPQAPATAFPAPTPAPSQEAGIRKHFRPRDTVPAGVDQPAAAVAEPSGLPASPFPAAPMIVPDMPAPVLAPPVEPVQVPQPPKEETRKRRRKIPRHW